MSPLAAVSQTSLPFIPGWGELRPFVAELWLIGTVVAVLLTPFFVRRPNAACAAVSLVGLAGGVATLLLVGPIETGPADRFSPMLVSDGVAYLWKLLLLGFTGGVVALWFAARDDSMHEGDGPEFFTLLLGATFGMSLMGSAANLLMLFMAVEMASLPSYVLAGFRKTHRVGAEASLKYVLFGAAASSVMVYGLSLLYGLYGTLQLYPSPAGDGLAGLIVNQPASPALLAVGLVGLIAGLGFKIAAVPFHLWCPDVFEGAGVDVTTFLSVASKGAGLVLLLRVVMAVADAAGYQPAAVTTGLAVTLGVLGVVTCTVGNTAAYTQTNVKRLLAYSSIAHAGYMLCALSLLAVGRRGGAGTTDPSAAAAQAVLLYLVVYVFMNLGAFTVAAAVARQTGTEDLAGFAGLGRRSPVLAACMTACLFSLIGLPPFAGFVAKVNLMWVLVQNGGWWWVLVAGVGVNTAISLYYYARILRAMYLEAGDGPRFLGHPVGIVISTTCAAALVLLFIGWGPLDRLTRTHSRLRPAGVTVIPSPTTGPSVAAGS